MPPALSAVGTQGSGGLVGYNASGATITQTYATGTVDASTLGGELVGSNVRDHRAILSGHNHVRDIRAASAAAPAPAVSGSQHQPDAKSGKLPSTYAGCGFCQRLVSPAPGYYPQLFGVNYVLASIPPTRRGSMVKPESGAAPILIMAYHAATRQRIVNGLSVSTAATTASGCQHLAIGADGGSAVSLSGGVSLCRCAGHADGDHRASIAVAADAASRVYGDADPAWTYRSAAPPGRVAIRCRARWRHRRQPQSDVSICGITRARWARQTIRYASYRGQPHRHPARDRPVIADAKSRGLAMPIRR